MQGSLKGQKGTFQVRKNRFLMALGPEGLHGLRLIVPSPAIIIILNGIPMLECIRQQEMKAIYVKH